MYGRRQSGYSSVYLVKKRSFGEYLSTRELTDSLEDVTVLKETESRSSMLDFV